MYEAFYGLTEKPFNLTPDPRFLFLSEKHRDAFAHLLYGIKDRTGFVMVSGEIGTGKTTICRSLLNQLDPDTELAFIFNPYLSPEELLRKINEDFGIASRGASVKELIDELNEYLLERNAAGKNCVLVIDEAQNLEPRVLEQVRLLSNLETETQKLLQIVLIGQPELSQHLQLPELRQLNQRITARYHLKSLDAEETVQYIAYRLRVAGGRKKVQFTKSALRAIHKLSGGTPRVINAICDRALLIGYTKESYSITPSIIRQAVKETRGEAPKQSKKLAAFLTKLLPNPSLLVTSALVLILAFYVIPLRYPNPSEQPQRITVPNQQAATLLLPPTQESAQTQSKEPEPEPISSEQPAPEAAPDASTPKSSEPQPNPEPPAPEQKSGPVAEQEQETDPQSAPDMNAAMQSKPDGANLDCLRGISGETARNAAIAAVLRAWNKAPLSGGPKDDSIEGLSECAKENALEIETLAPTPDEIAAMGMPTLARIHADKQSIWVAAAGANDGKVRITTDGRKTALLSKEEFTSVYEDQAVVFWKDSAPNTPTLKDGMSGPEVRSLQEQLKSFNLLGEVSGAYDEKTHRAVSKLQAQMGLSIDGIAGRQVRMVLSRGGSVSQTGETSVELTDKGIEASQAKAAEPSPQPSPTQSAKSETPAKGKDAKPVVETPQPKATETSPAQSSEKPAAPQIQTPPPSQPAQEPPAQTPTKATETQNDSGLVKSEDLPPPREETLAPPKSETPKEVTPPADVSLPLTPSDASKDKPEGNSAG